MADGFVLLLFIHFHNCMIFFFFDLYLSLYGYILILLSMMAAVNWKLFAFYGKYIRNRPSKNVFCQALQVNCVQWDCVFCAWSCRAFLFALCLAVLGRTSDVVQFWSVRLFYCSEFLHHFTLFTEDSVLSFEFLCSKIINS